MKAKLYNQAGEEKGVVELNSAIFGIEKPKADIVHQVVTSILSSGRNSVASTKTRAEVRGGGKNPWQQKGTGRARAGSSRSPLWRGGGVTFGPRSSAAGGRNFEKKVTKRMRTLGLFSVLSDKASTQKVVVLEDLQLSAPKTKELAQILKKLRDSAQLGRTLAIIISEKQKPVVIAGRNLPGSRIRSANQLNILDLLSADSLVILQDALPVIEKTYLKPSSAAGK